MKKLILLCVYIFVSSIIFSENIETINDSIIITRDYLSGIEFVLSHIESEKSESTGNKILMIPMENKFSFIFWGISDTGESNESGISVQRLEAAYQQSEMKAAITLLDFFQNNVEQVKMRALQADVEYKPKTFEEAFVNEFCMEIQKDEFYLDHITANHIPPLIIQKTFESNEYKENGFGKIYTILIFYPELNDETKEIMNNINIQELLNNYTKNDENNN